MAETLSGVNGSVIRWAREFYHETPEQVSRDIGVNLPLYLNWESGKEYPTYEQFKTISEVLGKPSAIFFFPEPPQIPNLMDDLRTLSDAVSKKLSKNIMQQFESARMYQLDLQAISRGHIGFFAQRDLFPDNFPDLCRFLRKKLAFSIADQKSIRNADTIFEMFRERLYDLGVYVFKDDFRENSVAGICLRDDAYPVIMINDAMPSARQTYALFHELYHLVLDTSGVDFIASDFYSFLDEKQAQDERMCDAFSAAFLVPVEDLQAELGRNHPISEAHIAALSALYSVDRATILYQLYQIGLITVCEYEHYKEGFRRATFHIGTDSKPSSVGDPYSTKLTNLGKNYARAVFAQYAFHQIDCVAATRMLRCKVDQLDILQDYAFQCL